MPEYTVNNEELKERIEWDLRCALPPELKWEVVVETWLDSNVELGYKDGLYQFVFCNVIGLIQDQYQPTIDYAVKRTLEHNEKLPLRHKAKFQQLKGEERFVMLFAPAEVGGINTQFVEAVLPSLAPKCKITDVGWALCPVAGSDAEVQTAMQNTIKRWRAAQADPAKVRFDSKTIKVGSNVGKDVHLTCVVGYLLA